MYIAIAYRYGWTDEDWYIVAWGADMQTVCSRAQEENRSRGGKYGILVTDLSREDQPDVAYYSSSWGEKRPRFCENSYVWRQVGLMAIHAVNSGQDVNPGLIQQWITEQKEIAKILAGSDESDSAMESKGVSHA